MAATRKVETGRTSWQSEPADGGVGRRPSLEKLKFNEEGNVSYFAAMLKSTDMRPLEHLVHSLLRRGPFVPIKGSTDVRQSMKKRKPSWQQRLTLTVIQVLWFLEFPLKQLGKTLEVIGNVWVANGGLVKTLWRLLLSSLVPCKKDSLVVPREGDKDYKTILGLVDPRTKLYVEDSAEAAESMYPATPDSDKSTRAASIFPGIYEQGRRRTGDVLAMASKLVYESRAVVQEVVTKSWGMHFVEFYSCWNEFQKRNSTQAVIFTDAPENVKAVVIAWRGTEPFNAYDWSTDLDFSWFEIKGMGKIHMGFVEALGLADRRDMKTFETLRKKRIQRQDAEGAKTSELDVYAGVPSTPRARAAASGLSQNVINEPNKILAYDDITDKVRKLLKANPKAKLFITGHSLGGALSTLYTAMLYHYKEKDLTDRLTAIYTFGQPRVGDEEFANFMVQKMEDSQSPFYRVVYANDIVPRVPFDDQIFMFKHGGHCFYFNSLFKGQTLIEAPNKNYFMGSKILIMHLNAWWELVHSLLLRATYGEQFSESLGSILFRMLGLLVPGIGGHSPVNYVNAMRLGKPWPMIPKVSQEVQDTWQDLVGVADTIRDFLSSVYQTARNTVSTKLFETQ